MISAYVYPGISNAYKLRVIYINQEEKAKEIIKIVCGFFDMNPVQIMNQSRKGEFVTARQISMFYLKDKTRLSLKAIGALFDGRDHSTVIYAIETVQDRIDTDKRYKANVVAIGKLLEHINFKDDSTPDLPTVGSN